MKRLIKYLSIVIPALLILFSCQDYLDREPLSQITPDNYLNDESQLGAYSITLYPSFFPTDNKFMTDMNTDDMANVTYDNKYVPGQYKVSQSGGDWDFSSIYKCNYFFENVLPQWQSNKITGNPEIIKHYIGEMYFLRAYTYFSKLMTIGDFPILRKTYPDNLEILKSISKRSPCNEVARFIISDLDSAIILLKDVSPDGQKNRLSKNCAYLLKSRVALFEGTWLKYFKGTPFVPNGPNWPGKNKDYNSKYSFPTGSIDAEINYFLETSMAAAKVVADNVALVGNNRVLQQSVSDAVNPYFNMFGDVNMSKYSEVLLWRAYSRSLSIMHGIQLYLSEGSNGVGVTKGLVESFLMENGLPIYSTSSGYFGDDYISTVRKNRDNRLWLFLKEPGQVNVLYNTNVSGGNPIVPVEIFPDITSGTALHKYTTGYALRKGGNFDASQGSGPTVSYGYTGVVVFRAVEAYLNYMEACYERYGQLDNDAKKYWTDIRNRAGVDNNYQKTIDNTDLNKEKLNDWGAYSGGVVIDATLYNIRRERRCELMAEGLRIMDLKRWRAMDQMITTPYHIEGFKLWGPMKDWYVKNGTSILIFGKDNAKSNVSSSDLSHYLRPYEVLGTSLAFDGYKWNMAHYLSPIAVNHFLITSENNEVESSPLYQNPGWPTISNEGPIK